MYEIPQHIIRFYSNTDYAMECIALKQITSIRVENLNDPFDPVLDCATDFSDKYKSLLAYVKEHHSAQLTSFKERLPEQIWNTVVADWTALANEIRKKMFIFSTCAVSKEKHPHPRNNLYMWSHYGNGHRGVAIEFNTTVLAKSFVRQNDPDSEDWLWKMNYTKKIPRFKCEDIFELVMTATSGTDNLESYRQKQVIILQERYSSKNEVWENEDEWRIAWENNETKLKTLRHDLPNNAITAVYLGCRAAEQEQIRNDFIYETQRHFPNASVFRANMRPGEYALDFEKIAG